MEKPRRLYVDSLGQVSHDVNGKASTEVLGTVSPVHAAGPMLLAVLYKARERMMGSGPAITALRAETDAAIARATGGKNGH